MLSYNKEKPLIAFVVPTGIGASIGGFFGYGSIVGRKFSKNFYFLFKPKGVIVGCFFGIIDNMLYV